MNTFLIWFTGYVLIAVLTAYLLKYTELGDYLREDDGTDHNFLITLAGMSVFLWPVTYVIRALFLGGKVVEKSWDRLGEWILKGFAKINLEK